MMNKNEWKKVKLKELIYKPISGEWGKDYNTDNENTAYVIRTTNFTNNGSVDIFNKEVVKREISLSKIKEKKLKMNDIIIEKSGGSPTQPVGRVVFFDIEDDKNFLCNNFTSILRANEKIFPKYLFYNLRYLYQNKAVLKYQNKTTGIINLKLQNYIDDTNIFLPSLEEQKKICKILDYLFNILEMKKQQLSELDKLVKFQFLKMFGDLETNSFSWNKTYLKSLTLLITKGASPNWQGFSYVDNDNQTLFITSENVRDRTLDLVKKKYVQNEFNFKQKKSILKKGDFLINIVGASIGRVAQYNLEYRANINQAVALVRLKENIINHTYLLFYLNSNKAMNMYNKMQVSVARANLSLKNIEELEIILPPIELQNKFSDFVKQVDKSKVELQKSIDETQLLFDSLMDKYFG